MKVEPYLFFEGRCAEALEFYRNALGARIVAQLRYADSPEAMPGPPLPPDKIMHASFTVGTTTLMASDGNCSGQPKFAGVSLSLSADDAAAAQRMFDALGDGGQVQMPLAKTFFAPCFGIVTDRFGVSWMVIAEK